jgi:hypothetical protein
MAKLPLDKKVMFMYIHAKLFGSASKMYYLAAVRSFQPILQASCHLCRSPALGMPTYVVLM